MKNKIFLLALAASVLLIIPGCSKGKEKQAAPNGEKKEAQAAPLAVKTAPVAVKTVNRFVEAVGTLLPWDEVTVSSELAGTVDRITADLGDRVKAGQTLALLDTREPKLNLEDAKAAYQTSLKALEREKAKLTDAETTLKRYEELFKQGMVSASQFDNAKTQHQVAQAQLSESEAKAEQAHARLNLSKKHFEDTAIKSPISGEVKKRFVSSGETVNIGTKAFMIVSAGTLKFRGTVAEAAVPHIKGGQAVTIAVEAFKDKEFKGILKRLSPSVDAETRTLELEAEVPNPKGELKPGFFARGIISTKKESGVPFVPESAVYSFVGITKIFVIKDGVAHERMVKTGSRAGDSIEIIGELKTDEVVATTNLSNLYDGAKVSAGQ